MSKFLEIREISNTGKTKVWKVENLNGVALGKIGWYPGWRRYVFFPFANTLWDSTCLDHVKSFIDAEMQKRKAQ